MKPLLIFLFALSLPLLGKPADTVLRVNSTIQSYSASQPWQKNSPRKRSGLGTLLKDNRVLTTAEMAANAIYLEFQTANKSETVPARVVAIDYEANLALLAPIKEVGFLSKLTPAEISPTSKPGDHIDILQLEQNGTVQMTNGVIRSMSLKSTFLPNRYFLTYQFKGSLQSASSSFTLPAFRDGKLTGLLTSYNSKEQISDILAIDVITKFLADAADGEYEGFPTLGVSYGTTEDQNFRAWLKLPADEGGLYLDLIAPNGSAEAGGLKKNDVLLSIDGQMIDRRGYYEHSDYGTLLWVHLIGAKKVGEVLQAKVLRDGAAIDIPITLKPRPLPLLNAHTYDQAPPYFIKGGIVFQELSTPYLRAYGKDWAKIAPLNLLDVLSSPEDYSKERRRVVVLTRVVASAATIGYDRISNHIVETVNGQPIPGLPELAKAFENLPENGVHKIETDKVPYQLYLDEKLADEVDQQFLQRGLPGLSRLYDIPKVEK